MSELREKHDRRLAAAEGAAAGVAPVELSPLAALISGQVLRGGETVILLLKPSMWFVLLSSLKFLACVAIACIAAQLYDEQLPGRARSTWEIGLFLAGGRLTWATVVWMGRYYLLTTQRVLRLSGVFAVEACECPLRKVARVRVIKTQRERFLNLGSIEIIPSDENFAIDVWHMVAQPRDVQNEILAAVSRAKQGPMHG